jgi:hypothetical protein
MNINSRLSKLERSLRSRERFFVWLKTLQTKGGYSDYWKFGTFESWASENGEEGLLYNLFFEVNTAVMSAADKWRELCGWASLLGIAMLGATPGPKSPSIQDFLPVWREKLCTLLRQVVALEQGVELISDGYFEGHEVLFSDVKTKLASSHESANLLIAGYNCFAGESGEEPIDPHAIEAFEERGVGKLLNHWYMSANSKALATQGKIFEARDVVLAWLEVNPAATG